MNRRSKIQLRTREKDDLSNVRKRKSSTPVSKTPTYERDKKRKQRARLADGALPKKRGPKEKLGLKSMTVEEKREYERTRKRDARLKKKLELHEQDEKLAENDKESEAKEHPNDDRTSEEEEVEVLHQDFSMEEMRNVEDSDVESDGGSDDEHVDRGAASAIMNIINPGRKNRDGKHLKTLLNNKLERFDENEKLDILVILTPFLPNDVKTVLKEKGIDVMKLPRCIKRTSFSSLSSSTSFRYKDDLLKMLKKSRSKIAAESIFYLYQSIAESWVSERKLLRETCGISIGDSVAPIEDTVRATITSQEVESIGHLTSPSKIVKVSLMNQSMKEIDLQQRGAPQAIASSFNVSYKSAKRLISDVANGKSAQEMAARKKRKTVLDTAWPEKVHEFCLTKPICREAPGESVSIGYGVRAEKYIRQFSISEIFTFFVMKYPDFPYKRSTFRTMIPKNLVQATLRDVVQNTCPLHENVKRSVKALNRFFKKNKLKHLAVPTSTIDLSLKMICNPYSDDEKANRNPLNWSPECTKGSCKECNGSNWIESLKLAVKAKCLEQKMITYSQWVKEKDGEKNKQVLKQKKCTIVEFLETVLFNALVANRFAEHLRKAWSQWQVTKYPIRVISSSPNDVAIRTREDFQEDVKFLCTSETVSTHRGVGVITMVCYPVVLEVFKVDGSKEMHGFILMSDTKSKNYDTVKYFEEKCIEFIRNDGYNIVRYDRVTDGCSSQFWCYGSYFHLDHMPADLGIELINFHRYERYEGKNLSDALGSLLKRKMRSGALQNRIFGNKDDYLMRMLEEIDDDTNLEDLVFDSKTEAFSWLQMCMEKTEDTEFSKSFKKIEMVWVDREDIPSNLVEEKAVKKIPKVKSFNSATSIAGRSGVYMRDNSCVCNDCLSGNVLKCTSKQNGTYRNYNLQKKNGKARKETIEYDDESDESDDEFEYDTAIDDLSDDSSDDSDEEEEDRKYLDADDLSPGQFVLYQWEDKVFYVGTVGEIEIREENPTLITVNLLSKYSTRNQKVHFIWPGQPHDVTIDDLHTSKCLQSLPHPMMDRRGTMVIFNRNAFVKISLEHIK